jgi:hypothetical protein
MDEGKDVAWLRQVIEGDKAAAEAATPGPWAFEGDDPTDDDLYSVHEGEHGDLVGQTVAFTRDRQVENGEHMARHDPQDALARCESDLALLDLHFPVAYEPPWQRPGWTECGECGPNDGSSEFVTVPAAGESFYPCQTVRLVASGYRHRDGYAEHWGD